ncbi:MULTISPECIES: endonuclease MutS2 [Helicobacter]|uniref:Endonuclease MutS2 n=1 Tax=Helicobacter ibis TaxID=2962633 RepID=A0ABT4VG46_9HELI|nr:MULTISPECIES: endonuclease MutS2 [Helicobacter]MDA3966404.1 endonuclease MutS2 [Helicobacter sp. WB40]MDA3968981.1 endonuclease MutS2 [Helicobacter ibis]
MELVKKLDLEEYISLFETFLARKKDIKLEGDSKIHLSYIKELEDIDFTSPKEVKNLDKELQLLRKFGHLHLDDIFEFVKIIKYFLYLKSLKSILDTKSLLDKWISGINIPSPILEITKTFKDNGKIKEGVYLELDSVCESIRIIKRDIQNILREYLQKESLIPYLVDSQIHLVDDEDCLLLRAGFNNVLKGSIINRSKFGFFYVVPSQIASMRDKLSTLANKKEELIFEIARDISQTFTKNLLFLKFINREFDRFDNYQARLNFARVKNLEFLLTKDSKNLKICEFKHPALKNPKSISINFSGDILMITGVNAGGKTMLLKSILSVVFLSKYLIPMPINASKSAIGNFKFIDLILDDPQSSKNDISTFAGRMLAFSEILKKTEGIIGVDEIELGTDSDEAASLFQILLDNLASKGNKIILTTHHKRLASLMAGDSRVQLLATLYDERKEIPTYEFLDGTIGKSYAFETAIRYGIPKMLINKARELHGADKERLNELIENSAKLEMKLQNKIRNENLKLQELDNKLQNLKHKEEALQNEFEAKKRELERIYNNAINEAKEAVKLKSSQEIHRKLNTANNILKAIKEQKAIKSIEVKEFKIGDSVKYGNSKGVILQLQKNVALVQMTDGMKLRVGIDKLKHTQIQQTKQSSFNVETPKNANVMLDLHGMRGEEALEALDEFISNSLIAGFDEVLVYHGIGTGRLSSLVRDFLQSHPKVVEFVDAPQKSGGFGAKIIKL